jgi:hypothetical protein
LAIRAIDYPTHRRPDAGAGPIPRQDPACQPIYSAAQNKGPGRNNQGKRVSQLDIEPDSAING